MEDGQSLAREATKCKATGKGLVAWGEEKNRQCRNKDVKYTADGESIKDVGDQPRSDCRGTCADGDGPKSDCRGTCGDGAGDGPGSKCRGPCGDGPKSECRTTRGDGAGDGPKSECRGKCGDRAGDGPKSKCRGPCGDGAGDGPRIKCRGTCGDGDGPRSECRGPYGASDSCLLVNLDVKCKQGECCSHDGERLGFACGVACGDNICLQRNKDVKCEPKEHTGSHRHACIEACGSGCNGVCVQINVNVVNKEIFVCENTNENKRKAVHFNLRCDSTVGDDDSEVDVAFDPEVVLRRKGGRSKKEDQVTDSDLTLSDTDSGLGHDSHLVNTWSTFHSASSRKDSGNYEFHVVSVAALNGNLHNVSKSRFFKSFRSRSVRKSKTLIIETAWPSSVWYVPPPFEDQTVVFSKMFEEVRGCKLYNDLSSRRKHILEAKFEIVSSEATFLKSLHTMEEHFAYSTELSDDTVLPRSDRHSLFGDIPAVIKCSCRFLAGLQECLEGDTHMRDIFTYIKDFASKNFHVYVKYCSNLKYIQETQKRLMDKNVKFSEALQRLEGNPVCGRLPLNSFLSLPLGRILKLDLPIKEALKKMKEEETEYIPCKEASELLRKLGHECNEGAKQFETMGDTLKIANKLDFPVEMAAFPISCSSRRLLKQGSVTHHSSKCYTTETLYVFLFNDLLVITRKQSNECYLVSEYCARDLVILTRTKGIPHLPSRFTSDSEGKYMLLLTIVNQEQSEFKSEMVLSCRNGKERQEWLEAASSETATYVEYKTWNRPRVSTVLPFTAQEPDHLSLSTGDEVIVIKRLTNGTFRRLYESGTGLGLHPGTLRFTIIASGMITSPESRVKKSTSVLLKSKHSTDGWRLQPWSYSVSGSR